MNYFNRGLYVVPTDQEKSPQATDVPLNPHIAHGNVLASQ